MPAPNAKNLKEWFPTLSAEGAKEWARRIKAATGHRYEVDKVLDDLSDHMGAYGIEAIRGDYYVDGYYQDLVALYVNTGDTYNATILYETEKERFLLTTMGDWVEHNERRYRIQ